MAKQQNKRPKLSREEVVSNEVASSAERYHDVYFTHRTGALVGWEQPGEHQILLRGAGDVQLMVEVFSPEIIRFRYAVDASFSDAPSYALAMTAPKKRVLFEVRESGNFLSISTGRLLCKIARTDLQLQLFEAETQTLLLEEALPFTARSTIMNGLEYLRVSHRARTGEAYFGMGDKTCPANLRGRTLENWNQDSFGYQKNTDPLYRTIPFYYSLYQGRAYGIFLHNTWRSRFDFDRANTGTATFSVNGGEMDYFFIYGPELLDISRRYMDLTGRPELVPLWVLGFHQCRWSYHPERRVRELAREFREQKIPCDAIYLDIDYMDGYRCFTWDHAHFPKPKQLVADLRREGFQTVVMIDPGIRVDPAYEVYRSGIEQHVFCRRSSGELMKGPVWPPKCVFPDYTDPTVRSWWGELYHQLYNEDGVSGFWNDMNEPAVFKVSSMTFPDHVLHHCEGFGGDHRKVHNIYGQQMSRATYEGLKKLQPDKRPFVLTRATFAGGQRYAAVWTGDNVASWEHLRLANVQCQRLSISGFSLVGTDIGGFVGIPTGELMVRWLQLGVFHPIFRIHSMGNNMDGAAEAEAKEVRVAEQANRLDQEPWSFGEPYTSQARRAIEFRYTLLPYLYTCIQRSAKVGDPIIKPLTFFDQSDPETTKREAEFIFGDHLFVCPVLKADARSVTAYLPRGDWFDYHRAALYVGGRKIRFQLAPEQIPVLVRAGAVIPTYPVQQYTGEKEIHKVGLRAYFGTLSENWWYSDAGEGYGYREGSYRLARFRTISSERSFTIRQEVEGAFQPTAGDYSLKIFGLPFEVVSMKVDGAETSFSQVPSRVLVVDIPLDFTVLEILF